jgi:hypothetical protein
MYVCMRIITEIVLRFVAFQICDGGFLDQLYICMYVYMYVYMYVCIYVCVYVCVYVCIYAHNDRSSFVAFQICDDSFLD